jgi:lysozyme family protein
MTFDDVFKTLIGYEGGYSNNPADPGGETMYGITKRVAVANGYTGEMRDLTLDQAKAIAKSQYWDKFHCDQYDGAIGFEVFDAAFNGGHPTQWLQQAAGVTADGVIGPATIAAIKAIDPVRVCARFLAYRLEYMDSLNDWQTFSKGWAKRIAKNLLIGAQ